MRGLDIEKTRADLAELRRSIAQTEESLDGVERGDEARSNAFMGLTSDLRDIARLIRSHLSPDGTKIWDLTGPKLREIAERIDRAQAKRFDEWMNNRDLPKSDGA